MVLLWVALGSALGGLARYGMATWYLHRKAGTPDWPLDTLLVNVSGAGLIGALLAAGPADPGVGPQWTAMFLVTGFLGSYTTVSALSLQVLVLARNRLPGRALAYLMVTLVGGMTAVVLGYQAGLRLF
ncbi:MAG: CrcB family protein [Wenzhouxiangella sp.]|nr:MAG: CrcB family protein [Wenzhouxiangella sp.]